MQRATYDGIPFTLLDWNDLDQITRELAQKVEVSGEKYDRLIAVANGGLTMVRHFGDQIGLRTISMLQTAFYKNINETEPEPEVLQPLSVDVTDENLLVFEDIIDTGATLEFVQALLLDQYQARSVKVAALVKKSHASVEPDFVALHDDAWIIYPYETRESIIALTDKWRSKLEPAELRYRLQGIGFTQEDIERWSK